MNEYILPQESHLLFPVLSVVICKMTLTYIETYRLSQQTGPDLYPSTNLKNGSEVVFCYLSNPQSSSISISSLYLG